MGGDDDANCQLPMRNGGGPGGCAALVRSTALTPARQNRRDRPKRERYLGYKLDRALTLYGLGTFTLEPAERAVRRFTHLLLLHKDVSLCSSDWR